MTSPQSMWPTWLPLREDLKNLSPYGAPQISGVLHLNTNENPFPLPQPVVEAISTRINQRIADLNRYPDRDAVLLREKLANYINLLSQTSFSKENVWAANGSNEVLQTLLLACGGPTSLALGFTPSYSVHPLIAQITATPWIAGFREPTFSLDIDAAVEKILTANPRLVFITTPNNPTGNVLPLADIFRIAEAAASISALLVVDEAYQEFSQEDSAVTLIGQFPNLVVTRTMSKAFAFAGARVGYLVASPEVIDAMFITRLPYHLSSLTQAAAEAALDNQELLQAEVQFLVSERQRMSSVMTKAGFSVVDSQANFLLFAGFPDSSSDTWKYFLDRGILIRDVGLAGFLRVTIGTVAENESFLTELLKLRP